VAVGVDIGILQALALSNGRQFGSPKYLQPSLAKQRRVQCKVARRKKGSNRRRKAVQPLVKQQAQVANQRRGGWHNVTRHLVGACGMMVLEDVNLNVIPQNGTLARCAPDVRLGMFPELRDYKAREAGVEIVTGNPANTSQAGSGYGFLAPRSLKVCTHRCPDCGLVLDRDLNAAGNILSAGTGRSDATVEGCIMRSPRSSLL
jgi:putative transposase